MYKIQSRYNKPNFFNEIIGSVTFSNYYDGSLIISLHKFLSVVKKK